MINAWKFGKLQKEYTQNLTRCKKFDPNSDACLESWFKIWQVVKKSTQNLTRRIFLNSKYDALYFFKFRIWRVVFFSIQNPTRNRIFNSKSCFWNKHEKCKICRVHGVNRTETWFFGCRYFFKIWHVEKFLIQNLTRCIVFNPKSDAL